MPSPAARRKRDGAAWARRVEGAPPARSRRRVSAGVPARSRR